jgi:hyperosmotically inducible protein
MSYLYRALGTFTIAVLTVVTLGVSVATAQVSAIKDGWLVMKVHSEMVDEDLLNGSDIDVDVKDGVVTLQGTVASEAARARALEVARKNDGVKSVVDQLQVAPGRRGTMDKPTGQAPSTSERAADKTAGAAQKTGRAVDDGWIKSKIYAQYLADWNTILDDSDIDIDVDNNVVTLNGTVKSAEAKSKAVATAKATDGVKSVRDNLRVAR